jgi:phosphohistidine phosphatase SixA
MSLSIPQAGRRAHGFGTRATGLVCRVDQERRVVHRRNLLALALGLAMLGSGCASAQPTDQPVAADSPQGAALARRLQQGGLVIFLRHADTGGEPCDSTYPIGERSGQRNISAGGRRQAAEIGRQFRALGLPVDEPVLASPVFRGRDTAEIAFGAERVRVTDSLIADDYAGERLGWVLDEHRRLFSAPVAPGRNRVLVGHRGPVQMIVGGRVSGTRLPEGGALILDPRGAAGFEILGVLLLVPLLNGGNPECAWR